MQSVSFGFIALLALAAGAQGAAAQATKSFADPDYGYTLAYPANANVYTDDYAAGALSATKIPAIAITLPESLFAGTNLGDAELAIGVSKDPAIVAACARADSARGETASGRETIHGIAFARFTMQDAGAGNRYDSTIFRTVHNGMCYEIVEQLHSMAIENYPEGQVKPFEPAPIAAQLHAITKSFAFRK